MEYGDYEEPHNADDNSPYWIMHDTLCLTKNPAEKQKDFFLNRTRFSDTAKRRQGLYMVLYIDIWDNMYYRYNP